MILLLRNVDCNKNYMLCDSSCFSPSIFALLPTAKKKNPGFGFFVKIHLLESSKLGLLGL